MRNNPKFPQSVTFPDEMLVSVTSELTTLDTKHVKFMQIFQALKIFLELSYS